MSKILDKQDVERARVTATLAHQGQYRWDDEPYVNHPIRVSNFFSSPLYRIVALLHDVVEDTSVTLSEIEASFGPKVADGVNAVTRREGESYVDFILRAKRHYIGRTVKIADIEDNLQDLKKGSMKDKYELALVVLRTPPHGDSIKI